MWLILPTRIETSQQTASAAECRPCSDRPECGIPKSAVRIGEVHGVQHVVDLDPELQPRRVGQLHIFEQRQVQPPLIRTTDRVARNDRGADRVDRLGLEGRGIEPGKVEGSSVGGDVHPAAMLVAGEHRVEQAHLPQAVYELRIVRLRPGIQNRLVEAAEQLLERVVVASLWPPGRSAYCAASGSSSGVFDDELVAAVAVADPQLIRPLLVPEATRGCRRFRASAGSCVRPTPG